MQGGFCSLNTAGTMVLGGEVKSVGPLKKGEVVKQAGHHLARTCGGMSRH